MKIYDISMPLHEGTPCWPEKTQLTLKSVQSCLGDRYMVSSSFAMDIHLGTHLDAPRHFVKGGAAVDQISLDALVGPCRVVEFIGHEGSSIPAQIMTAPVERVLFKTGNSSLLSQRKFEPHFTFLSESLAHSLVASGVRAVGIDYFSVDSFQAPDKPVHRILLEAGVLILEGLDLSGVPPGDYQLVALPLHLVGAEGSPVRAILVKLDDS